MSVSNWSENPSLIVAARQRVKSDPSNLGGVEVHPVPIKNGDFVLFDYTLKVKESGDVVETTIESVAKEKGIRHEHEETEGPEVHRYEPFFLVVGGGWVPKGLDEGLVGLEAGQTTTIEVPPDKGYGARDASKVRLVPLRKFRNEGITPVPGIQVTVDGKVGQIRTVGAGRVQVDYNHPLAGRTLVYEVSLRNVVETPEEKIRNLIHKRLPAVDQTKFALQLNPDELTIEVPEEAFFLEDLQLAKKAVSADIEKFFPEISKISFLETFKKTAPPKTEETKSAEESEKNKK
jgi:peptidylprolyl isomerase